LLPRGARFELSQRKGTATRFDSSSLGYQRDMSIARQCKIRSSQQPDACVRHSNGVRPGFAKSPLVPVSLPMRVVPPEKHAPPPTQRQHNFLQQHNIGSSRYTEDLVKPANSGGFHEGVVFAPPSRDAPPPVVQRNLEEDRLVVAKADDGQGIVKATAQQQKASHGMIIDMVSSRAALESL
jgi:hypothetical protein